MCKKGGEKFCIVHCNTQDIYKTEVVFVKQGP